MPTASAIMIAIILAMPIASAIMIAIILAMPIAWGPCPGDPGLGPGPGAPARGPGPGPRARAMARVSGQGPRPEARAGARGRGPGREPERSNFCLKFFLDQKGFLHPPVWGREQLVVDPLPAAHRPPGCRQMRPEILVK